MEHQTRVKPLINKINLPQIEKERTKQETDRVLERHQQNNKSEAPSFYCQSHKSEETEYYGSQPIARQRKRVHWANTQTEAKEEMPALQSRPDYTQTLKLSF